MQFSASFGSLRCLVFIFPWGFLCGVSNAEVLPTDGVVDETAVSLVKWRGAGWRVFIFVCRPVPRDGVMPAIGDEALDTVRMAVPSSGGVQCGYFFIVPAFSEEVRSFFLVEVSIALAFGGFVVPVGVERPLVADGGGQLI